MKRELKYIELKTGYSDDGPAWIGYVKTSASGRTVYFNDRAFQSLRGGRGSYFDVESGEEYWISGIKKRGSNRHPSGRGKIVVDRRAVGELLDKKGWSELPYDLYEVADIVDKFPVERISALLNGRENKGE